MPTAFVCNNDETAYYFIHYLSLRDFVSRGCLRDGFYDNKFATAGTPAITTIRGCHRIAERGECRSPPDVGPESLPDMVLVRERW